MERAEKKIGSIGVSEVLEAGPLRMDEIARQIKWEISRFLFLLVSIL